MTTDLPGRERASTSAIPLVGQRRTRREDLLVPLLGPRNRRELSAGIVLWLAALIYFWSWWFSADHVRTLGGFILVTALLLWLTLLPGYFLYFLARARRPAPTCGIPRNARVAMVVTKAPSEPFHVVAATLEAILRQTVPHDTWLADEDPSETTLAWCRAHGVLVCTRRGIADYHRATWPRRTRCKEGNLAYFYDTHGCANYDFVAQLDADHVPSPTYLHEMLKGFVADDVGYVSAPSICDSNAATSWSARGRLFVEGSLHGPLQAGYTNGWAPLCIGSHYAVRTKALREAGGLGPELAEDHSTTLMMNAAGWRGVHAMDAIAHGDGPLTFADLATQEFQWSRSIVTILLVHLGRYYRKLPGKLKFQFVFSELWYPIFSVVMLCSFLMPIVGVVFDVTFVNVGYIEFLLHFVPISVVLVLLAMRWRRWGILRPHDAKVVAWEGVIFQIARWPWTLAGTIAAIVDWHRGRTAEFRVTPKGSDPQGPVPLRIVLPYAALSLGSAVPVLLVGGNVEARGFYIFCAVNALIYALVLVTLAAKHGRENAVPGTTSARRPGFVVGGLSALLISMSVAGLYVRALPGLEGLAWGPGGFRLVRTTFSVAGAGQGAAGVRRFSLEPWRPAARVPPAARRQ